MAGVKKLFELKENRCGDENDAKYMSDRVWEFRSSFVRNWIKSNKSLIPTDGALEMIQSQLLRGDNNQTARKKCWSHLETELECIPQFNFGAEDASCRSPMINLPLSPTSNNVMRNPPTSPPHIPNVPLLSVDISGSITSPRKSPYKKNKPQSPLVTATLDTSSSGVASLSREASIKLATLRSPVPMLKISDSIMLGSPGPRSQSARGSTKEQGFVSMNLMSARTHDEDEKVLKGIEMGGSPREKESACINNNPKPISQMTMMERQAHWLAKKKETLEAQRAEKEKEDEKYSFKPNTMNSKRTFSSNQLVSSKHSSSSNQLVSSKHSSSSNQLVSTKHSSSSNQLINKVIEGKKESTQRTFNRTSSIDEKLSNAKTKLKAASKLSQAGKSLNKVGSSSNVNKVGGGVASASLEGNSSSVPSKKKSQAPKTRMSKRLEEEQKQSTGNSNENTTPDEAVDEGDVSGDENETSCDNEQVTEEAEKEEVEEEKAPVYVPGEFWWREEGGRGQHRVNDGSEFQMWSIYRRKDKNRDIKGVSMLVGRMEQPPYDEKVIQIMFDTDVWTEESAFKWWQVNSFRYTGEADHSTGKLKLEVARQVKQPAVITRPDHSPIRKVAVAGPTTSPIE